MDAKQERLDAALARLILAQSQNAALLEALKRIQDYSRGILDETLEGQEYLDEGWVWRVANDAIRNSEGRVA